MLDIVVDHELSCIGLHTLRVVVEFDSLFVPGTRQFIRKHYKFQVEKPISFSCKFKPLLFNGTQRIIVQVGVKNTCSVDVLLVQVELVTVIDSLRCTSLSAKNDEMINSPAVVSPGATMYFLYMLECPNQVHFQADMEIGRITARWRTDLAENGRLMSQPLLWKEENSPSVSLSLLTPTSKVCVRQPIDVRICIANFQNRDIDAVLIYKSEHESNAIVGPVRRELGVLKPGDSIFEDVSVMPLIAGLFVFRNLFVVDLLSNHQYSPNSPLALFFEE